MLTPDVSIREWRSLALRVITNSTMPSHQLFSLWLGTPGCVTCGVEGRVKEGGVGTYMHGTIRCCRLDVLLTIFLSDERVQRPFAGKMASCGASALSFHFRGPRRSYSSNPCNFELDFRRDDVRAQSGECVDRVERPRIVKSAIFQLDRSMWCCLVVVCGEWSRMMEIPFLRRCGVTIVDGLPTVERGTCVEELTNGAVLELEKLKSERNKTWAECATWLQSLYGPNWPRAGDLPKQTVYSRKENC